MKALFLEDYGRISLREIANPVLEPGKAIVKIISTTICGSDISAFKKKGNPVKLPIVLGHESTGIISEISDEDSRISGLKAGDRVLINPYINCGKCYPCSLGHTNCCDSLRVLGCASTDGSMMQYFLYPVSKLIKFEDDIPWDIAPIAEPLTIALHAIHNVNMQPKEKFCVLGAGPIGIMAALAAQNVYGAESILVDIIDERLDLAQNLGVKYTINSQKYDVLKEISRITNGRMAETVMEASGANACIAGTLSYASYRGRIAFTGWPTRDTALTTSLVTRKELTIIGSRTGVQSELREALDIIRTEKIDVRPLLTKVVSYEELPDMIVRMANEPQKYLKVGALWE